MKKIISLTKVFIKEFYQNLEIFDKQKKKFNKKSMFFWLITIAFFGITYVSYEIITFLKRVGQEEIFLNIYFFILAIFLLFQTIIVCANIFFFSKDIEKILHMPIKPLELLLSKFSTLLCMLYVSEVIFGFIPLALYGLLTNVHFLFYFWEIIILVIFPILLAMCISTLMLIIMRFAKFIRNKDIFQLIITIIMIMVLCVIEANILNSVFKTQNEEQVLQEVNDFNKRIEQIGKYFLIIDPSIDILSHPSNIAVFLSFIKLIFYHIIGGVIFITIGKRTYLKDILKNMISYSNKKKKLIDIKKRTKLYSIRKTYIKKEFKMLIREPIFFMQCIFPIAIILITGIMLVFVLLPIVIEAMQDETIKNEIQNLSFNMEAVCMILILLQILFSISNISLTAISREGKNAIFIKYVPIELYKQFTYKNIPQVVLNFLVSIIVLGIIWYLIPSIKILYLLMTLIIAIFINLINSYLMLIVDLRRPNLTWDTEYSVVKRSDNKFFQYAFMIINVLFLMYIANIFQSVNIITALVIEIIIFAIIFIIIDRGIKKWQKKLFNKII